MKTKQRTLLRILGRGKIISLLLLIFIVLLFVAFPYNSAKASGGITVDSVASKDDGAALGSSLTWTHTVGSGSNVILLVSVTTDNSHTLNTTSGVTVDGTNMTKLTTATCPLTDITSPATNCHVELWYMTGVSTGAHTIVATIASGTSYMEAGSISFFNVDQVTPFGTANTNTGATSGIQATSVSVTTTDTNQVVVDVLGADNPATVGSGEVSQWNDRLITVNAGSTEAATGGTMTMSWNVTSGDWAEIGVPLNQVAPTPTNTPTPTPTSTPTPTNIPTPTPIPTAAQSSNSSSNTSGSSQPNPNSIPGWSKTIMAGPHFLGTPQFISGGNGFAIAQTFISNTAIHDDISVTITKIDPLDLLLPNNVIPFPWSQGLNTAGDIFNYSVVSAFNGYPILNFDKPVTIILPYDQTKLSRIAPAKLSIAAYNQSSRRWKLLPNIVVNTQNHTVATTVTKFSYFVVVYPAKIFSSK